MKALIGKTVLKKWIEKEYSIFQWYWSMNILQCILDSQSFFYFYRFYLKTYNIVYIIKTFYPKSNAGLKVSLAILHMTTFILRSSNLEWQEKEPIICGRVYFQHKRNLSVSHTHTYTHIHLCSFLGNRK